MLITKEQLIQTKGKIGALLYEVGVATENFDIEHIHILEK